MLEALIRRTKPSRSWLARTVVLIGAPWLCLLASPYGFSLVDYYFGMRDLYTYSVIVIQKV